MIKALRIAINALMWVAGVTAGINANEPRKLALCALAAVVLGYASYLSEVEDE